MKVINIAEMLLLLLHCFLAAACGPACAGCWMLDGRADGCRVQSAVWAVACGVCGWGQPENHHEASNNPCSKSCAEAKCTQSAPATGSCDAAAAATAVRAPRPPSCTTRTRVWTRRGRRHRTSHCLCRAPATCGGQLVTPVGPVPEVAQAVAAAGKVRALCSGRRPWAHHGQG